MSGSENRKMRLQRALRHTRGGEVRTAWLAAVSNAVHREVDRADLLPLDVADSLFQQYANSFQRCLSGEETCFHMRIASASADRLFALIHTLGQGLSSTPVVLFGRHWEYIGGLRLDAASALGAAASLLRIDVDDLRVSSLNSSDGLLLDHLEREREIELWVWGSRWLSILNDDG